MALVVPKVRGLVSGAVAGALMFGGATLVWTGVQRDDAVSARDRVPTEGLPHKGALPRDARVTIVACSEFQCPFSARARHTVDALIVDNPDLAFFHAHLPLRSHAYAELRARAGVAAQRQGRFWSMHDALYEGEVVDEASALALARGLGLATERFARDLRDPATAAEVQRQSRLCTDQGVRAVPTFFINGRELRGAVPIEEFQRVIDDVRD
ncbi:MAG: DsbA family protein [Nannocystales bacterium]